RIEGYEMLMEKERKDTQSTPTALEPKKLALIEPLVRSPEGKAQLLAELELGNDELVALAQENQKKLDESEEKLERFYTRHNFRR
ncbi:hypothetical protein COY95_01365, partial [Candidatus Woesearchaeota archaeon CG_4_10_14_0_8_um_filter_47_5]